MKNTKQKGLMYKKWPCETFETLVLNVLLVFFYTQGDKVPLFSSSPGAKRLKF